jgi:hypothetical protein
MYPSSGTTSSQSSPLTRSVNAARRAVTCAPAAG